MNTNSDKETINKIYEEIKKFNPQNKIIGESKAHGNKKKPKEGESFLDVEFSKFCQEKFKEAYLGEGNVHGGKIFEKSRRADALICINKNSHLYVELKFVNEYGHWNSFRDSIFQSVTYKVVSENIIAFSWEYIENKLVDQNSDVFKLQELQQTIINNLYAWLKISYLKISISKDEKKYLESNTELQDNESNNKSKKAPGKVKNFINNIKLHLKCLNDFSSRNRNRQLLNYIKKIDTDIGWQDGYILPLCQQMTNSRIRKPGSGEYCYVKNDEYELSLGCHILSLRSAGQGDGVFGSGLIHSLAGLNNWSVNIVVDPYSCNQDEFHKKSQELVNDIWEKTGAAFLYYGREGNSNNLKLIWSPQL
jgi:hypothetical protein